MKKKKNTPKNLKKGTKLITGILDLENGRTLMLRTFQQWTGFHYQSSFSVEAEGCMGAKSLQSCLNFCDPMDYSLLVSSVYGILQTRVL